MNDVLKAVLIVTAAIVFTITTTIIINVYTNDGTKGLTEEECINYYFRTGSEGFHCSAFTSEQAKCKLACEEYGAVYGHYDRGFNNEECWCNIDGIPHQIY